MLTEGRYYVVARARIAHDVLIRQPVGGFEDEEAALSYACDVLGLDLASLDVRQHEAVDPNPRLLAQMSDAADESMSQMRAAWERERAGWESTRQAGAEQARHLTEARNVWQERALAAEQRLVALEGLHGPFVEPRGEPLEGIALRPPAPDDVEPAEFSPDWIDRALAKHGLHLERYATPAGTERMGDYARLVVRMPDGTGLVVTGRVDGSLAVAWNWQDARPGHWTNRTQPESNG